MSYDLSAIKAKINQLSNNGKASGAGKGNRPKLKFWKPELGQHNIRFLPYKDTNGQPFQEVSYYDNRNLSEMRFVAPMQFGLPDPVLELLTDLKKDRSKEAWQVWKNLQAKERYYAPILVRGQEDQGVQIWDINPKLVKDIYGFLTHQDYADEDMMDTESGYDFTVTVSPTDRVFNGNPVKEIKLQPRRKPSPLSEDEAEIKKVLEGIPDLQAYFKAQVKSVEEIKNILDNFLAGNGTPTNPVVLSESAEENSKEDAANSTGTEVTSSDADVAKVKKAKKSIDDAFEDL